LLLPLPLTISLSRDPLLDSGNDPFLLFEAEPELDAMAVAVTVAVAMEAGRSFQC
jgi:hypothetical protein